MVKRAPKGSSKARQRPADGPGPADEQPPEQEEAGPSGAADRPVRVYADGKAAREVAGGR